MSNLTVTRGDDRVLSTIVRDEDDVIVDLTGVQELTFTVRRPSDWAIVLTKTKTAGGIAVAAPLTGELLISVAAADTAALGGAYVFDLEMRDPAGKITTLDRGGFYVEADVTGNTTGTGLLSLADVRAHVNTTLSDIALAALLDAATADVNGMAGTRGAQTLNVQTGMSRMILLPRRLTLITAITERWAGYFGSTSYDRVLAASDWRLLDNGWTLERLPYGTNPPYAIGGAWWSPVLDIAATPADDLLARNVAILALLDLSLRPRGTGSISIGSYSETFRGDSSVASERLQILSGITALAPFA